MSETTILKRIQLAFSMVGAKLFRNQVGRYKLEDGRWIASGLCKGSSDLIGWHTITITPEMVGKKIGLFVACEVKTEKGKIRPEQENFIRVVNEAGGCGFVARNATEALLALQNWGKDEP